MLTIAIPTFNREKQLLKTLKDLECQTDQNFNIVISDNHSSYDIGKMLIDNFNEEFRKRIKVRVRTINVGADANIVGMFELVTTGWMWIIGDDDTHYNDAVENINKYIEKYQEASVIQLSPFEYLKKDFVIRSINEFVEINYDKVCEKTAHLLCGDFGSCGNKLYNTEKLSNLVELAFRHSYSCMTTGVVMLNALRFNHMVVLSNCKLGDMGETHWNRKYVSLGASTIADIDFGLDATIRKKLLYIINLPYKIPLHYWMLKENHYDEDKFLERLYYGFYRYHLPFKERIGFYFRMKLFSIDFIYKIHLMLKSVEKRLKASRKKRR